MSEPEEEPGGREEAGDGNLTADFADYSDLEKKGWGEEVGDGNLTADFADYSDLEKKGWGEEVGEGSLTADFADYSDLEKKGWGGGGRSPESRVWGLALKFIWKLWIGNFEEWT